MTRAQLGRLLADHRTVIEFALREAIARHSTRVCSGADPCELRKAYQQLLAELETSQ